MPQPVQPPEIPAIIQPASFEDATSPDQLSNGTPVSVSNRTLPTEVIATPTSTETFAPESSSLTASKSAALLGPPISVGYSLQPAPVALASERVEEREQRRATGDLVRTGESGSREESSPQFQSIPITPSQKIGALGNEQRARGNPIVNSQFSISKIPSTSVGGVTTSSPTPGSSPAVASEDSSLHSSPTTPIFSPSNTSTLRFETPNIKRLVTQERGGEVKEFEFSVPTRQAQALPNEKVPPVPNQQQPAPQPPASPVPETTVPVTPFSVGGVIELTADRQEYDEQQKVVTAIGNVVLRFREALLNADRVSVNLPNRLIVAEGNVALTRGQQVLRGERFEYYFVQDSGVVLNASGELYTPTTGTDLALLTPPDGTVATGPQRPLSDRITRNEPLQGITSPGGYGFVVGSERAITNVANLDKGGTVNRYRYEADRVDFDSQGAIATNVRITNDPFSPPELELRADTARFTRLEPLVDEVVASRPRLVFDQGLEVPLLRNRITIDRREREPGLVNFGYDGTDRGGLYVERTFEILNTPAVRFSLTPQYFIQKAISDGSIIDPSVFGVRSRLNAILGPRTTLTGRAVLTTVDPNDVENRLRASLRLQQIIGTTLPHTLSLEYSYRDRLFNGSLGFQTVQSSIGAVLTSPVIPLGQTDIYLTYQAGAQYINADTDREDLLKPDRRNDRISLGRYQASATLSRDFVLWQGQALPPTPTEGLRYTPTPVRPNLRLNTDVTGVASVYSSGDSQESLSGSVRLVGQLGHFSRPYLDYTGFNIGYTQVLRGELSPFLFDRVADTRILSGGITQQIYGPFRVGFQTSLNLNTGREISTDYFVEYSRRTYNILLRYNPVLQIGSLSLRISDFNWRGNPGLFDGSEIRPVVQGVER